MKKQALNLNVNRNCVTFQKEVVNSLVILLWVHPFPEFLEKMFTKKPYLFSVHSIYLCIYVLLLVLLINHAYWLITINMLTPQKLMC